MKKIHIKSLSDFSNNKNLREDELENISILFIFDLDKNIFYYTNKDSNKKLKENFESLKEYDYKNAFIMECLKKSHPISEEHFNELINTMLSEFYTMKKKELMNYLELEEWII